MLGAALGAYHRQGDIGLPELPDCRSLLDAPLEQWLATGQLYVLFVHLSSDKYGFFEEAVYSEKAGSRVSAKVLPGQTVAGIEDLSVFVCKRSMPAIKA
jgi:hypothetical protein